MGYMISRIYVKPKGKADFIDSYLISHKFSNEKITKIAEALTNPILEEFTIDKFPSIKDFDYIVEIGYKPGVTDNKGHTAEETILDLFHLKEKGGLAVYTSKIFLFSKPLKEVEEIAATLHNPLIERSYIASLKEINKNGGLPLKVPEVILNKTIPVIKISLLNTKDEELEKIGKEGIKEKEDIRRGPLALSLSSMKVIQEHFAKLKRDPTDIELEYEEHNSLEELHPEGASEAEGVVE